jgi:hypothetical protein
MLTGAAALLAAPLPEGTAIAATLMFAAGAPPGVRSIPEIDPLDATCTVAHTRIATHIFKECIAAIIP